MQPFAHVSVFYHFFAIFEKQRIFTILKENQKRMVWGEKV